MNAKIKVVWLCHVSNPQIRQQLQFARFTPLAILKHILKKGRPFDRAIWNTNGIKEFEAFKDVELHVITEHCDLKSQIQEFKMNGVYYHIFKNEDETTINVIKKKLGIRKYPSYKKNRSVICRIINEIKPDIVNLIGAERSFYASAVLDLPPTIPVYLTLQTLMSVPGFIDKYPISQDEYNYRTFYEKKIIQRANFLGCKNENMNTFIHNEINSNLMILNTTIALGSDIYKEENKKEYDFVYFAIDIEKAADHAIEAFAITHQCYPNIKLHIVGGYSKSTKEKLDQLIKKHNIEEAISFTGKLDSHENVIKEIRKAKFALLPFKVDVLPTTIREAMANGLPLITEKTIELNEEKETVLLSEIGNIKDLSENMLKLLAHPDFAYKLKKNAFEMVEKSYNNNILMRELVTAYKAAIENFYNGTPIPKELLFN